MKRSFLAIAGAMALGLISSCSLTLTPVESTPPPKAYLIVMNMVSQTSLSGDIYYSVQATTAATLTSQQIISIDQTVAYSEKSTPVQITPFTNDSITIYGSVKKPGDLNWSTGTWGFRNTVSNNDTLILILTSKN